MDDKTPPILPASATMPDSDNVSGLVLARLDAIIRELQDLRHTLVTRASEAPTTPASLTQRLSGVLAPPDRADSLHPADKPHPADEW